MIPAVICQHFSLGPHPFLYLLCERKQTQKQKTGFYLIQVQNVKHNIHLVLICYTRYSSDSVWTRWGICREPHQCLEPDHVFWARDERCYPQHTRGPCPKGELLTATGSGGIGECKCKPTGTLGRYYWGPGDSCHEHFTRGPCVEQGTLFLPNGQCGCHEDLPHYDADTGLCYEIGKRNFCICL